MLEMVNHEDKLWKIMQQEFPGHVSVECARYKAGK